MSVNIRTDELLLKHPIIATIAMEQSHSDACGKMHSSLHKVRLCRKYPQLHCFKSNYTGRYSYCIILQYITFYTDCPCMDQNFLPCHPHIIIVSILVPWSISPFKSRSTWVCIPVITHIQPVYKPSL